MDVVQLLTQAKAAIDTPEKWIKYSRMGCYGGHCALGALDWARGEGLLRSDMEEHTPEVKFLAVAIPQKAKDGCMVYYTNKIRQFFEPTHITSSIQIAWYNNHDYTTHKDIMEWFDRAITLATSATMTPALFPVAQMEMAVAQKEKESELCLQN